MSRKRKIVASIVLVLLVAMGAVVNAHDIPLDRPFGLANSSVIQEATGLDSTEIMSALQDGSSIALLIEANNADIEAVIASLVDEATVQINESKDSAISRLPEAISQQLDRSWHWRFSGKTPAFVSIFRKGNLTKPKMESDAAEPQEATAAGTNLLALFEANGGDVDGLVADLVAEAITQLNQFASARIESLEEVFGEQLNATYADQGRRRLRFGRPRLLLPNTP